MKSILIIALSIFTINFLQAQSHRDTVMLDSSKVEEIKNMPMDTTNQRMPIAPLHRKDSLRKDNQMDDAIPKKQKSSQKKI